jgi:phage terminase small subunit
MSKQKIEPPEHLSPESQAWFAKVLEDYEGFESHHIKLLILACESWDRCQQARRELAGAGSLTFIDRWGQPRAMPQIQAEATAKISFARLLRELCLDIAPPTEKTRPPRRGGY